MHPAVTYLIYIVSALVMLGIFTAVYTTVTRYKEFELIREGNIAAVLSYGGALVGFSFTLCSSIAVHASFVMFLVWALPPWWCNWSSTPLCPAPSTGCTRPSKKTTSPWAA